ncbi:MAG: IPTL-CTERM sorting domain-containing protein [Burkholderiaceae bacterium]|jgi:hypothetical protein|nr:IPTL-CTERM sorting domain-containing protein [Burkholderiaceae bacterium]
MDSMKTTPPNGADTVRRIVHWLAMMAGVVLLQACGNAVKPSWIETPLVADAYRTTSNSNPHYAPRESRLLVNRDASTQLKFSYATLPGGSMFKLLVDSTKNEASVTPESYTLNSSKVASARLVLYVDKVTTPGYLKITSAHKVGADCFAREDEEPAGCDQVVQSTGGALTDGGPATDADNPSQPLRITERGFYSFDVTPLVKNKLDHNAESMFVMSAIQNPETDPANPGIEYGSFEFASKEQQVGAAHVMHQPQLLISLIDAAGYTQQATNTTSVRQSSTNPAVASQNFSEDEDLWMSGAPGNQAYALIDGSTLNLGGMSLRNALTMAGPLKGKQSLMMFVNTPVQDASVASPEVVFYRRASLNQGNPVRSWNDGWSEPQEKDRLAVLALGRDVPNQQLVLDTSKPYMDSLASAFLQDAHAPNIAYAGTTNLQQQLSLDSDNNTRTAHGPRLVTVLVDEATPENSLFSTQVLFDQHDSHYSLSYKAPDSPVRARLGQLFARQDASKLKISPWARWKKISRPYITPINIIVPTAGASAVMTTDPNPADQDPPDSEESMGYQLKDARANRSVGRYQGIVSMPGHNLRTVIEFENLPLPVPTLSGPATVDTPPGSTVITMEANAPAPLRLNVVDPVGEHIDDTTQWLITSSHPADTMPGVILQTDGSVAFAATFSGLGTRTLRVTSQGDSSISATLDVTVNQGTLAGQVITFTTWPPAEALVGGSYTVAAKGGASSNPVVFTVEGTCTVADSVVNFVGTGTCTINADQAGNASYAPAARAQQTFAIVLPRLAITTTSLGGLEVGKAYRLALTASGGVPPYTWTATDSNKPLPAGLSLSADGVLSGTPSAAGDYTSLVTVADSSAVPQTVALVKASGAPVSQVFSGTVATAGAMAVTPVPTLGQWALVLLSMILAGFAAVGVRRVRES